MEMTDRIHRCILAVCSMCIGIFSVIFLLCNEDTIQYLDCNNKCVNECSDMFRCGEANFLYMQLDTF